MDNKRITTRLIMAILSAGMLSFLGILDETATTVTFPTLIKEFNITTDQVQWMNTLVLLVIAIVVTLSSKIRLKIPTKKIFTIGVCLFMVGLVIDAFAKTFVLLLFGRMLQGMGTGFGLPLMYNIILTQVPHNKLGTMMGLGTMITACAVALGPVFGGVVTDTLGWRYIFIISIPLIAIALISGNYSIMQINQLKNIKIKFTQWILISLSLILFIIGFTNIARNKILSFQVFGVICLGIICLIVWIFIAQKDVHPLIDPYIFTNLKFSGQLFAYCMVKTVTLALGFSFPIYVQVINHGSISLSGWLVFPGAVCNALMALVAGRLLDKHGARIPIIIGIANSLVWCIVMAINGNHLNNLTIMTLYALYYIGYGLSLSTLMTSGLTALTSKQQAQGNAIFNTFQQFSGAIGTALAGVLIAMGQKIRFISYSKATAVGVKWTFIALCFLMIIAFINALIFVPKKLKNYI